VGRHEARLRAFKAAHPKIPITTGHMPLSFFDQTPTWG